MALVMPLFFPIMKKKYTHIFFDLDNTLWDFENNSRVAMRKTFNHFGIKETVDDFEAFFEVYLKNNKNLWMGYRKKLVKKKDLVKRRFQETFDELHIEGLKPDEVNDFYLNEMPNQNILLDNAIEVLSYLQVKGYKMYIITNGFKEVQHQKIKNSGLSTYFSKIFISEEIKTPKPGRAIFEYAIKSANAKKDKCIMIGDDWDVDIMGALSFGIDAVHINRKKNSCDFSSQKNAVYHFTELKPILRLM